MATNSGALRAKTAERGYGSKWQSARKAFLARLGNQYCVKCQARGLLNPAPCEWTGRHRPTRAASGYALTTSSPIKAISTCSGIEPTGQPLCADDHDITKQRDEHGREEQGNDINGRPTYQGVIVAHLDFLPRHLPAFLHFHTE